MTPSEAAGPHHDLRVAEAGAPLHRAQAAALMVHGRGADASDMVSLADILAQRILAARRRGRHLSRIRVSTA
jgi:hypothetical protein